MFDGKRLAFERVCEQHFWSKKIDQKHAGASTVLAAQGNERCLWTRTRPGYNHAFVEVQEANPTPVERSTAPRRDAVKVADLFNPRQAIQCVRKMELVFHITNDLKLAPRSLLGKAAGELRKAETRERRSVSLSGG